MTHFRFTKRIRKKNILLYIPHGDTKLLPLAMKLTIGTTRSPIRISYAIMDKYKTMIMTTGAIRPAFFPRVRLATCS